MDAYIILIVIVLLGILSKNLAVWAAGAVLIILRLIPSGQPLEWVNHYGMKIGIAILTMGVLAPIALGKVSLSDLWHSFKSLHGLAAIAVGIAVAWLGGRGAGLLTGSPTVVTGLMIGTIIGVALLRGVPVGPLIAAGILSLFAGWLK
ncbi:uncharacterized membrane protein (DUF441 family) [Scopulibacillus daqui]|uniref:UPF0756 membrane protein JOD45_002395 n=1 Tax=Scopulibacillus daqui TaxID=1469162 RepID=A0ABS2Q1J9_9BACL|nr:DUF441 domain-containing protein [Scopulibacillus daqui]MBM7646169.1 uncharacterized membrane protein (DUF441 family) [Scopulibacillus daqui]